MEINVAPQRILVLPDQINPEEARELSWTKKLSAFDAVSKITGFLSRPHDDDFELIYQEHRYEPFWHIIATSRYIYDRSAIYQVPVTGSEVKKVTYQKSDYPVTNGHIHLSVLEHCDQDSKEEIIIDGVSGQNNSDFSKYISLESKVVTGKIEKSVPQNSIMVPPQIRASSLMRQTLAKMIKGIEADKILEESVEVPCIDLYYHPIYAFQYRWVSKNKEAIIEIDGLTGEIKSGLRVFREYIGKVIDPNFLFDVGADAAGLIIPGGSIAVKVAKKYLDSKK
ncbi:hypothetical protein KBC75_05515 [Candidatus Shapirobacteria bacterium]|nr:hypothetical protein [Candidatus Shapirobacteria bacterium]